MTTAPAASWQVFTVANGVTAARMACTPVLVLLILAGIPSWPALVAWVVLSATDSLDGWVARRRGATASGAFLDPLADKLLVLSALATLAGQGVFSWVAVLVLGAREVLISVYRSWVARRGISVPARPLAKAKTATEFVAVGVVLLPAIAPAADPAGRALLWVAVVLAWVSGAHYLLDSRATPTG